MKINSICWNITSDCNENCKFCIRSIFPDLSFEENKIIAKKIAESNIEKLTFAGGEPMLYKRLFELVDYIKSINPNIILSLTTNGKNITRDSLELICSKFDWITLPIDASTNELNNTLGRGSNHLDKVLWLLNELKNSKINVKINTVVSAQNSNDIMNIKNIVNKYEIKRWKLFRFYSNGECLNEKDESIGNLLTDSIEDIICRNKKGLSLHYLRKQYKLVK